MSYQYDALNRLTRITQEPGDGTGVAAGVEQRIDYAYAAAGRRTSAVRYADVEGAEPVVYSIYAYDAASRLVRLVHGDDPNLAYGNAFNGDPLARYDYVR